MCFIKSEIKFEQITKHLHSACLIHIKNRLGIVTHESLFIVWSILDELFIT